MSQGHLVYQDIAREVLGKVYSAIKNIQIAQNMNIYIYMYIYMCMHVHIYKIIVCKTKILNMTSIVIYNDLR
jgi:hypothetical protein